MNYVFIINETRNSWIHSDSQFQYEPRFYLLALFLDIFKHLKTTQEILVPWCVYTFSFTCICI